MRLYGFQGQAGRWKVEELDTREEGPRMLVGENVAAVITDRRALAFSAFTGGFFTQNLSLDEMIVEDMVNDNVVILSTVTRRLVFRSQLAVWTELR